MGIQITDIIDAMHALSAEAHDNGLLQMVGKKTVMELAASKLIELTLMQEALSQQKKLYEDAYTELKAYHSFGTLAEIKDNMEMFAAYRHVCGGLPPEAVSNIVKQHAHKIPSWVVCFRCNNRKSPLCYKCTRNAFAPCGGEKGDNYSRV